MNEIKPILFGVCVHVYDKFPHSVERFFCGGKRIVSYTNRMFVCIENSICRTHFLRA